MPTGSTVSAWRRAARRTGRGPRPVTLGNAANAIQGGERFQPLTLTTPGTLTLSAVGIHVRHPNAGAGDYVGHFLSSDEELNRIWYQGAYTNDTDMVPIAAV